ncbi:hypothetical protein SISSUDRAFT_1119066 [Sistotremastrum suecicum HHB10207 ss-3]|uniref:Fe2OG dioxygenase domain-containing protein n=1 Tax=Sistotremastrum suecicum HHB10207 ss-3 TaxID=1314776 RepID=A0A166E993_9AGAM|nr:hypothetical protein SISSUDRAFT_1119066 [Sistotremastrum suecicum HHB10207 ss-3]
MEPVTEPENHHLLKTITKLEHLQELRKAVEETKESPIFAQGTWEFPNSQLILWYNEGSDARCLKFPTANKEELKRLSDACDPATFGRNQQDVLDESYRLARKMDITNFSINMGFNFHDLLTYATRRLLGVQHEDKDFHAELYKLNVYGPESFFKAHKDTPRGDDMFGSLIIALPSEHEGGNFIVRNEEEQHSFESSQLSHSSSKSNSSKVAWAALWSHAEHEVTPVLSGYRVTLTFNLYFRTPASLSTPAPNIPPDAPALLNSLKACLNDPTFLPEGGLLGFGLKHEYPLSASSDLQNFVGFLKGSDSAIIKTADSLDMKAYLRAVYDVSERHGPESCLEDAKFGQNRWMLS